MTSGLEQYALDRPPAFIKYAAEFSINRRRGRRFVVVLRDGSAHEGVPVLPEIVEDQVPTFLFVIGTAEYRVPFADLMEALAVAEEGKTT